MYVFPFRGMAKTVASAQPQPFPTASWTGGTTEPTIPEAGDRLGGGLEANGKGRGRRRSRPGFIYNLLSFGVGRQAPNMARLSDLCGRELISHVYLCVYIVVNHPFVIHRRSTQMPQRISCISHGRLSRVVQNSSFCQLSWR